MLVWPTFTIALSSTFHGLVRMVKWSQQPRSRQTLTRRHAQSKQHQCQIYLSKPDHAYAFSWTPGTYTRCCMHCNKKLCFERCYLWCPNLTRRSLVLLQRCAAVMTDLLSELRIGLVHCCLWLAVAIVNELVCQDFPQQRKEVDPQSPALHCYRPGVFDFCSNAIIQNSTYELRDLAIWQPVNVCI